MFDPFARLGLEPRFALDVETLDARQRELARTLHPDRHVGAQASERRRVLNEAMDVNRAYRELKDPVSRAEALLRLRGFEPEATQSTMEPGFLMEMLERREALSEARAKGDLPRVREFAREVNAEFRSLQDRVATAFDALDSGASPAGAATAGQAPLLALLGRLRYLRRFLEEVAAIEDEIG
ncbi:MAG TPA: Fe-S protein assembly co-chaperone HscB [Polyangiaceae bacterium]|nr:Fe-S protein assembly co-chaperone HscB [Polyangiaceae bacterium]